MSSASADAKEVIPVGPKISLEFAAKFNDHINVIECKMLEKIHNAKPDSYVGTSCLVTSAALREYLTPGKEAKWTRSTVHPQTSQPIFQIEFSASGDSLPECNIQHSLTLIRSQNVYKIYQSFWGQYSMRLSTIDVSLVNLAALSPVKLWNLIVVNPQPSDIDSIAYRYPP
jgi:hypothetical protein